MAPSSSIAVLLLLVVAVVLSNVPSSGALASSSSSLLHQSSPSESETETDSSSGESSSSSSSEEAGEKEKEKEQEMEKAVAAEKAAQQELLKYAKEKGIVSPTNGTGWYKGIAREFVDAHNELRARYGVPPMKWDRKLARQARRWSNRMRKDCELVHSGHKYGESLFRSHDDWNATAKEAVFWWGKEESIYDRDTEQCTGGRAYKECGHFALMVGKRSTKVGCARAECFKGGVFITCNYYATDLKKKNKKKKKSTTN
jgi:uncharacterized protein YkwD